MAPSAGLPTTQSGGGDDSHNSDNSNNNNNNDALGNGKDSSGSGSGSNPPKDSIPPSLPLKVITRQVTVTQISTAVQTATIVLSSSGSSSSTGISTTTTQSSTSARSATSSFSTPTPLSSSTGSDSPSNSSAQDGSPSPSPTPLRMKPSLPLASIILGCLFFITLCFVIYVLYIRRSIFSSRFANLFRRKHTPAASTIGSFEPKEFRDFSRNTNFRRSARSFVVLPEFYLAASNQAETSRAAFSPSRGKRLIALNTPYERSSYKSRDSHSQGYRVASSEIQFPEVPPSRTISAFDGYPFEHDATDIAPSFINGRPTEERSSGFPQSVQDMTVE